MSKILLSIGVKAWPAIRALLAWVGLGGIVGEVVLDRTDSAGVVEKTKTGLVVFALVGFIAVIVVALAVFALTGKLRWNSKSK